MTIDNQQLTITSLWVIPSLAGGGAEKAIATLLKNLDPQLMSPHLCLYKKEGVFLDEVEQAGIPVHSLDVNGRSDPRLLFRLTRLIKRLQPDITIGVLRSCGIQTTLAHRLSNNKGFVFINEQNTPSIEMQQFGNYRLKQLAYRPILKLTSGVIAISVGIKKDLQSHFQLPPNKSIVIPNPVDLVEIQQKATTLINHPWFEPPYIPLVSVGRLHPQKGHDILLDAFAEVKTAVPQTKLIIIGQGSEKEKLLAQTHHLNLEHDVNFIGFQANPYPYIAKATLFVLASRYEGFGNVLAEALGLKTAVVATNCPSGPADILAQGQAGLLCPPENAATLAQAITSLLNDPQKQDQMIKSGYDHVQKYAATAVAAQYTSFFKHFSISAF